MNPTQSLYRYSTLIDSTNRMNSLASRMDLMYRNPFETTLHNAQFIKNVPGTALTSFKGVDIPFNMVANSYANIGKINPPNHLNIPSDFFKLSEVKFLPTLPVLPNLDWILEEPEEVQEQPLDVITEYQIKSNLPIINDFIDNTTSEDNLLFQAFLESFQNIIQKNMTLKSLCRLLQFLSLWTSYMFLHVSLTENQKILISSLISSVVFCTSLIFEEK